MEPEDLWDKLVRQVMAARIHCTDEGRSDTAVLKELQEVEATVAALKDTLRGGDW